MGLEECGDPSAEGGAGAAAFQVLQQAMERLMQQEVRLCGPGGSGGGEERSAGMGKLKPHTQPAWQSAKTARLRP